MHMRPTVQAKLCTSSTYVPCLTGVRSIVVGGSGSRRSWSAGGASEDVVRGVRDDGVQHGASCFVAGCSSPGTCIERRAFARCVHTARFTLALISSTRPATYGRLDTSSPVACMNLAVECSPGAVVRHAQRVRRDATPP